MAKFRKITDNRNCFLHLPYVQIAPFTNPIKWYRGTTFITIEKQNRRFTINIIHICVYRRRCCCRWWNLIFDFGRSIGRGLLYKRCLVFNGFKNRLKNTCAKALLQFNWAHGFFSAQFFFFVFAIERDFLLLLIWHVYWADRCHRKFSQSRRAYLRMDDLYPSQKFMLE